MRVCGARVVDVGFPSLSGLQPSSSGRASLGDDHEEFGAVVIVGGASWVVDSGGSGCGCRLRYTPFPSFKFCLEMMQMCRLVCCGYKIEIS